MKKKAFVLVMNLFFILIPAISQESEKYNVTFGLNGGTGQNINGYKLDTDYTKGFSYYAINPHFSLGLNGGIFLTDRIRARFEYRYIDIRYGMDWGSNYPTYDKTITILYESSINFHFDYAPVSLKHFQLFVSPSLTYEYVVQDDFKNTLADGTINYKNYNVLKEEYQQNLWGGEISLLAKFKINDYIGITLTPGYTYFFEHFIDANDKPYQRMSINIGLEYSLF